MTSAFAIAATVGVIGILWSYLGSEDDDVHELYPHHFWMFGFVLFTGTMISMMISSVNGTATPTAAFLLGIDPAKVAGPLETAFQDIVGQGFLLGVSYVVFKYTEPDFWWLNTGCPKGCVPENNTFTTLASTILH